VRGEAVDLAGDPADPTWAMTGALDLLHRLHGATAHQVVTGSDHVDAWVHHPTAVVAGALRDPGAVRALAALHHRLAEELLARPVTVAGLHGDPSFGNILFDLGTQEVTGVVDWEAAHVGLPELDVIALVLARRAARGGREMGEEVVDLLTNGWSADERALLGPAWSVNAHLRPTTLVLLAWLGHVAANLEKAERYAANGWWLHHNVEAVLHGFAAQLDADGVDPLAAGEAATPDAAELAAAIRAADVDAAPVRPAVGVRAATPLRRTIVGASLASWLAYAWSAPVGVRVVLVLVAVLVGPALAIGRRSGGPGPDVLRQAVVGTAGAVGLVVLLSEVLLYAGLWSPGLLLVGVSAISCTLAVLVPRSSPGADAPVEPEVIDLRSLADAPAHRSEVVR
jgi:hypothetical protein